MEILDRIYRIELGHSAGDSASTEGGPSVSAFYVQGTESGLFIDAGFPDLERTQPILDYWRGPLGSFPTSWALVSHRHYEHAGGVKILKDATGCKIGVGHGDAEAVEADVGEGTNVVDQALTGGEVFDLGGRRVCAVATPGHTAGTMCYLVEDEGILFTGDHIMGQGTVVVRSDEGGSMAQHVASLEMLLDIDVRTVVSGHGPVMTDPMTQIPELVRHRQERETQILDMVRGGMAGVDDLVGRIYGESSERRLWLARHQVVSHLKKLEDEGRVVAVKEGVTYRAA